MPDQTIPNATRGAMYFATQVAECGNMIIGSVEQVGNRGLILYEDGVPVVQDTSHQSAYLRYQPLTQETLVPSKTRKNKGT